MSLRIEDVARSIGVSRQTVSWILNHEPNVGAATRERALAGPKALNYQPNMSARRLANRRSFLTAMEYDGPSPHYVMEVQGAVLKVCDARRYSAMVRHPAGWGHRRMRTCRDCDGRAVASDQDHKVERHNRSGAVCVGATTGRKSGKWVLTIRVAIRVALPLHAKVRTLITRVCRSFAMMTFVPSFRPTSWSRGRLILLPFIVA